MTNIQSRNIITACLLTVITCGLYSYYWMYKLNNDVAKINGEEENGGKVVLLTIVSCGLYFLYWAYKMGERVERFSGKNDEIVYFVGSIFIGILPLGMMQKAINDHLDEIYE